MVLTKLELAEIASSVLKQKLTPCIFTRRRLIIIKREISLL
jgi:hypothetical protein